MYNPFNLTDKVVAVIGGTSGIGYGMAKGLADAGATVILGGRNIENSIDIIKELGDRTSFLPIDVLDEESVKRFMDDIITKHGRLDSCFAVAGNATRSKPFDLTETSYWEKEIDTNLNSVYLCFREASNRMIRLGNGGSLVSISSITSRTASAYFNGYATAKAGVVGMTSTLSKKFAEFNIRINTVMPGTVNTKILRTHMPEEYRETFANTSVFKRLGEPEDFCGIAVYLASDASKWHTGDTIIIDGGASKNIFN